MYNHTEILRPEDIEPTLYALRINNTRMKNQEKYDKLMEKSF